MDSRHQVTHVAHVGTAHHLVGDGRLDVASEGRGVGYVAIEQGPVVDHLVVSRLDPVDLDATTCGGRTGLQTGHQPGLERLHSGQGRRAGVPGGLSPTGHDVRLVARLDKDPVETLIGCDVLAQGRHVAVTQHHGIQCVQALLGSRRGMCGPPLVDDTGLLDGQAGDVLQVGIRRVDHHRCVYTVECTPVGHDDLAATPLFGGCPQDADPTAQFCGNRRGRQTGAQASRGDDVVTTCMADPRQGVVLAEHSDHRPLGACIRLESRLQAIGTPDHRQTLLGQHARQQVVGDVLLEVELRLGMNGM